MELGGILWYVYRTSDGKLESIGSVLADPLPSGLTAVDRPAMTDSQTWDATTRTIVAKPAVPPDVDRVLDFLAIATYVDGRLTAAQRTTFRNQLGAFLGPYRFRDPSEPATGLK